MEVGCAQLFKGTWHVWWEGNIKWCANVSIFMLFILSLPPVYVCYVSHIKIKFVSLLLKMWGIRIRSWQCQESPVVQWSELSSPSWLQSLSLWTPFPNTRQCPGRDADGLISVLCLTYCSRLSLISSTKAKLHDPTSNLVYSLLVFPTLSTTSFSVFFLICTSGPGANHSQIHPGDVGFPSVFCD